MGSGAKSKGYAEMWGGNVKSIPDARAPLAAGKTINWTESVFAYTGSGIVHGGAAGSGAQLTHVDELMVVRAEHCCGIEGVEDAHVQLWLYPTREFTAIVQLRMRMEDGSMTLLVEEEFMLTPASTLFRRFARNESVAWSRSTEGGVGGEMLHLVIAPRMGEGSLLLGAPRSFSVPFAPT